MERLRERAFGSGLEAETSELLRASEPYVVPSALKRRVRERLLEGRPKSWLPILLRPSLLAAGLLLAVGAAAAVGGSVLLRSQRPAPAHVAQSTPLARPHVAPLPAPKPEPAPVATAAAAELGSEPPAAATAVADARRPAAERDVRAADSGAQSEATLVYGAAKALRSSGDAALAAKLLDDYAHRYPHGALAEEALALSIDVSLARGDGRAKALASKYLALYPEGHFRAKAERALGM